MSKTKKPQITVEHSGPSIFEVARYVHEETVRHCDYCGRDTAITVAGPCPEAMPTTMAAYVRAAT